MDVYLICDELNRFFVQWMKMINSFFEVILSMHPEPGRVLYAVDN